MGVAARISITIACLDLLLVIGGRPAEFESVGFTGASWLAAGTLTFVGVSAVWLVVSAVGARRKWDSARSAAAIAVFALSAFLLGASQELFVLADQTAQKLRGGVLIWLALVSAVLAVMAYRALARPQATKMKSTLRFLGQAAPWLLLLWVSLRWVYLYELHGALSVRALLPFAAYALAAVLVVEGSVRRRAAWLIASVALAGCAMAAGAVAATRSSPEAVVAGRAGDSASKFILLTVDTLRQDHVSCYNPQAPPTPNLCSLAEDGVLFELSYSAGPWTKPSFATLLTGVSPAVHGVTGDADAIPAELPTMAELLRGAGFRTMGVVRNAYLSRPAGYGRGFESYVQLGKTSMQTGLNSLGAALVSSLNTFSLAGELGLRAWPPRHAQVWTPLVTRNGVEWLREHAEEDFFLWLHYFDPHDPYVPPPAHMPEGDRAGSVTYYFDGMGRIRNGTWVPSQAERDRVRSLYAGEVRFVDDSVGQVLSTLKELGIYDETLIVLTSDHGEELWDHHGVAHGHTLYEELIRVPLVFKLPAGESPSKSRIDVAVGSERVLPTVLGILGLPRSEDLVHGESLAPLWSGEDGLEERQPPIYSTGLKIFEDREAVVFDGYKYIRFAVSLHEELYDLEADPGEKTSLVESLPGVADRGRLLIEQFRRVAEATRSRSALEGKEIELDAETLRDLRALGYVE